MSAYYTRYCAEHGDYDADIDGDQECEKCFKEGKTRPQKDAARIAELERELTAAQSRLREVEKDAARYRYLRDQQATIDGFWIAHGIVGCLTQWFGEPLDKAIDAAMSGGKGEV